jgi:hypothetical protein
LIPYRNNYDDIRKYRGYKKWKKPPVFVVWKI